MFLTSCSVLLPSDMCSNCFCSCWRSSEEKQELSGASSVPSSCFWSWRPGGSIWSKRQPSDWSCSTFPLWTCWTSWPIFPSSCSFTNQWSPTRSMTPATSDFSRCTDLWSVDMCTNLTYSLKYVDPVCSRWICRTCPRDVKCCLWSWNALQLRMF